ncbi:hypothetical protein PGT21_026306 [Puccinia graminis f. sp. tritici]|uniref:Uncharacterized protein n=1 Tax=Puccinia graminis f. sp. tritici TaxID=56615 RepID=A0A5B0RUD0_PUCGR|nr:hypothetical protein PGT21_026306 [Puccinia graminis f. sp. tritici]KAA1128988.1 hypothetical protein PGTUg99_018829 [Puccinia graminis f. sp. tritici]
MHFFKSAICFAAFCGLTNVHAKDIVCGPYHPNGYCGRVTTVRNDDISKPFSWEITAAEHSHDHIFKPCKAGRSGWCCIPELKYNFQIKKSYTPYDSMLRSNCIERKPAGM